MRETVYRELHELARSDDRIVVICADMGTFPGLRAEFPDRYINVGVAEPNSIAVAAGMAHEGWRPYVYSVAGFTVDRAYEAIKYCLGYWGQPVTLIGTGFGWRFHAIGRGHHPVNDLAALSALPDIELLAPATKASLRGMLHETPLGPRYIRLSDFPLVGDSPLPHRATEGIVLALGSCAGLVDQALSAGMRGAPPPRLQLVERLHAETVRHLMTAVPPGVPVVVVEDHAEGGGLADLVRRVSNRAVEHVYLPRRIDAITDSAESMLRHYGFDAPSLAARILSATGRFGCT